MSTLSLPPTLGLGPRPYRHVWTCDEFHRMGELGWFEDQYVMLIDGEILEMPDPNSPYAMSLSLTADTLRLALGLGFYVRDQLPLLLGKTTDPIPDIAVVPGAPRDYSRHPTTALLVVEISDSTLDYDLTDKASLFASANIQDYWVVNLPQRCVMVHRDPQPDATERFGWRYQHVTVFKPGSTIDPLAKPGATVAVDDLLP